MSFDDVIVIIVVMGPLVIMFGFLIWYLWDKYCLLPWEEEKDKKADEIYENIQRKRKADKAYQTYATLMDAGFEDSLNSILKDKNYDDFIDTINTLQDYINTTSCSCDEFADALNALGTPSEEKTEISKQKEPQVIFKPKVMIIEPEGQKPIKIAGENIISIKQDDKEVNPLDDWYNNFMKEIEQ